MARSQNHADATWLQPASRTLYVSTTGSDSNDGSATAPLRTIQQAISQAQADTTVIVRGGVYHEEVIFDHGGAGGAPLVLRNYPGELPIIDGSMDVANWTFVEGTVWRATFVHVNGVVHSGQGGPGSGFEDAAPESSCPDSYQYSGDRRAYLYVDDPPIPDQANWLKPVCIGTDAGIDAPADLPRGTFATDVVPPPLADRNRYARTTSTLYVNLADGSDPNDHQIRIAAYSKGIYFTGPSVAYVTVQGLGVRLALGSATVSSQPGLTHHITFDGIDVSLTKLRFESDFCTTNINVINSYFHDNEYENIHLESDDSLLYNNLIERTIAPWSLYGAIGINVLGVNNRVIGNTVRDIHKSEEGRGGYGIYLEEWYNGTGDVGCHSETNQNNLIEKNKVTGVEGTGIANSGGDNDIFQNNLVYQNGSAGIAMTAGGTDGGPVDQQRNADNNHIYHNTIYGNTDVGLSLNRRSNGVVKNNLLYANNPAKGAQVYVAPLGAQFTFDHNLNTDLGSNTDPLFVSEAGEDFHLQAGSPAIDTGMDVGVTDDFDGRSRPSGAGFDLGAYEWRAEASTPTTIPGSTGLRGRVLLQGRSNHGGARVEAGASVATTGGDGLFSLSLPPGDYTVTASLVGYLGSQTNVLLEASPNPQTLPPVMLVAGDCNHDGVIDLSDLILIARNYGLPASVEPAADLNADGVVDLMDLTILGQNYGLMGYQPWLATHARGAQR